ncbi:helix-turn-helix domain-containing protein [Mesorhizobium australicum]|uniref:helix-turn-helix domain-containing protein n=1 Tax=Mesorhizobium australicum TaxID=536018 RepID=UPI0033389B03
MDFDDRPDFAKRLEKARKDRGFRTPKDAARFFDWTYETYIQHEQGIRGISRAAAKYAKAFRVSEGWLLTGEGNAEQGQKVSGEEAIKELLSRIENLPEAALQPLWRSIDGYIKDAERSSPDRSPAHTEPANLLHGAKP